MRTNRRDMLRFAAAMGAAHCMEPLGVAARTEQRILDTHIHLFDPRRPGGIPWPLPQDPIYKPSLPDRYAAIATPLGVRGAIAIEASPRFEDNAWVLQVAAANPIIVGFIGDLVPGDTGFAQQLESLRRDPLFLGIRYGNLWNRDLASESRSEGFLHGLRQLADQGLTLDSANPDPALIAGLVHVSERVPSLRIVVDHLPSLQLPVDAAQRRAYLENLHRLAANPNVFIKLSEIPVLKNDHVLLDIAYYQDHLDQVWDTFGEDRILFGSDWPNSDHIASFADTLRLVRSYLKQKSPAVRDKFFWRNSVSAYQWHPRTTAQHEPVQIPG